MHIFYVAIQHLHSAMRWVVLALLIAAIVHAFSKRRGGSVYPGKDKLALFAFISTHIQLLLGLILYLFLSPYVKFTSDMMSNSIARFYSVEHITGMILAVALITVGYLRAKRQAELNKGWKTIWVFYAIGLLVILAMIPWPGRGLQGGWI